MKKLIYLFLLITVSASADDNIVFCDGKRATGCKDTPGCYFDGQGSNGRCKLCPPGYYCNDGNKTLCEEFEDCPPGSSVGIASGSAKKAGMYRKLDALTSAKCPRGYYCLEGSFMPIKCPDNKSSCKGSDDKEDCKPLGELSNCNGGVGQIDQADIYSLLKSKTDCENFTGGQWECEWTESNCTNSGYKWNENIGEGECQECKTVNGTTQCKAVESCESCVACQCKGYSSGGQKVLCPEGYICLEDAMATCQCKLPNEIEAVAGTTGLGAKDITDCIVTCDYFTDDGDCDAIKGCYWNGVRCQYCSPGFYCDGQGEHNCPYGSTSYPGSVSITECYIREITTGSYTYDLTDKGGPYYFNGYNKPLSFITTKFPADITGSVCK